MSDSHLISPEDTEISQQDATLHALSSRARDLSLAITNPATLAAKLRESLIDLVGPEQSRAYHIGASYDSVRGEVQVQIAAVTPEFAAQLQVERVVSGAHAGEQIATLGVAWQRTVKGWEVAVGVEGSLALGRGTSGIPYTSLLKTPREYQAAASFSVTVGRRRNGDPSCSRLDSASSASPARGGALSHSRSPSQVPPRCRADPRAMLSWCAIRCRSARAEHRSRSILARHLKGHTKWQSITSAWAASCAVASTRSKGIVPTPTHPLLTKATSFPACTVRARWCTGMGRGSGPAALPGKRLLTERRRLVADHVRLLRDLTLAANGVSIKSQPALGFGGSYNYGKMRIAAAYVHALITGDKQLAHAARNAWLANEQEQLKDGHWTHRDQCEQLCPQPHSEFILAAEALMWREALKQGDAELIGSCEASFGRSIAVWRLCSLGGIVCAPGARAKDPEDKSNDSGAPQWRNRPADAILARVLSKRPIKFRGLSVLLFDECIGRYGTIASAMLERLSDASLPKLRVPLHYVSLRDGGYVAWHEPTDANRRALGKDALSAVVHQVKGKPEVVYDWGKMPEVVTRGEVRVIGA